MFFDDLMDFRDLGHEINESIRKPISLYCERIVRILSRTKQNVVTVDRHNHHYKLEIHRDNHGNIVSIDVMRARHMHHGMKLTCSIVHNGNTWTAKSSSFDPVKDTRLYMRIQRIADELEHDW